VFTLSPASDLRAPYLPQALDQIARLLSAGDREPFSLSYGCFDRSFWAWKFTDFAGARFQEAAYTLAHLYSSERENPLRGQSKALEWTRASMAFWRTLQHSDGSFDEAYPFEHSLAATAFTGFYVGEAYRLIAGELPAAERDALRSTFARAADWLCRNDEHHGVLSNHLAAAAAALTVIERITEDHRYGARAQHFLKRIYDRQSCEGWYDEYGGADPGYQTHGTFYMARIWQLTGDSQLLDSLARSAAFLKHCIHPNGTLGGEYGSRNTEFYFPAGFEMLAASCKDAAAIAHFMRPGVAAKVPAGLGMMDRYNLLPMLNNYLFADVAATDAAAQSAPLPCEQEGEWHFRDAGLLIRSTASYYAVIGLSKGGVVKLYDRRSGRPVASDCGYWARLGDRRVVSSQSLTRPPRSKVEGGRIELDAEFVQINQRVMTPWLFMAFRLFSLTWGRFQAIADRIKRILVEVLVRRRRAVPLALKRIVTLLPSEVIVEDTLTGSVGVTVEAVAAGDKFATIHMGSSRYFQAQELRTSDVGILDGAAAALRNGQSFARKQAWPFT
jgi:hypothetical protein